jgi:hypothetical protein
VISIITIDINGQSRGLDYITYPDSCPFCHFGIEPIVLNAYINKSFTDLKYFDDAYIICRCPRNNCSKVFIGAYKYEYVQRKGYFFSGPMTIFPIFPEEKEFSKFIQEISPNFVQIYNQAFFAELHGLNLIAGSGYRKSFEFLIKDYIINKIDPEKKEVISESFLGTIINQYIEDSNIKEVAKRAAWLGNDETHYYRKWEEKDVKELIILIQLTIKWIEMVELTQSYIEEMPE